MRTVVVLHAKQAIGMGLMSAFARDGWRVRIWTTGQSTVFRDPARPDWVAVDPVSSHDPAVLFDCLVREAATGTEVVTNDEYCLDACSQLRARLGLPARLPPRLDRWTDKLTMKRGLRAAGISTPEFISLDPVPTALRAASAIARRLGLPVVVKPRREANNRGIEILRSIAQVEWWLDGHRSETGWHAESFVVGHLYHANALVTAGVVVPVLVGMYTRPLLALEVGQPAGSVTLPDEDPVAVAGRRVNDDVIRALGSAGSFVVHTEFFVTPTGESVVLEAAARAPGALVSEIAAVHKGVHLEEASFRLQVGAVLRPPTPSGLHAAWVWFPRRGMLAGLKDGRLAISSDFRLYEHQTPVLGGLLAWNADFNALVSDIREAEAFAQAAL